MIALAEPEVQDYLWLLRDTMARVSEINRLIWKDVNLEHRYVVLYTRKKPVWPSHLKESGAHDPDSL